MNEWELARQAEVKRKLELIVDPELRTRSQQIYTLLEKSYSHKDAKHDFSFLGTIFGFPLFVWSGLLRFNGQQGTIAGLGILLVLVAVYMVASTLQDMIWFNRMNQEVVMQIRALLNDEIGIKAASVINAVGPEDGVTLKEV